MKKIVNKSYLNIEISLYFKQLIIHNYVRDTKRMLYMYNIILLTSVKYSLLESEKLICSYRYYNTITIIAII